MAGSARSARWGSASTGLAAATKTSISNKIFIALRSSRIHTLCRKLGPPARRDIGRAAVIPVAGAFVEDIETFRTRMSCGRPRYDCLQRSTLNKSFGPREFRIFLILLHFVAL